MQCWLDLRNNSKMRGRQDFSPSSTKSTRTSLAPTSCYSLVEKVNCNLRILRIRLRVDSGWLVSLLARVREPVEVSSPVEKSRWRPWLSFSRSKITNLAHSTTLTRLTRTLIHSTLSESLLSVEFVVPTLNSSW